MEGVENLLLESSANGQLMRVVEILNKLSHEDILQMRPDVFDEILQNILSAQDFSGPLAAASAAHVLLNVAGMKVSKTCFDKAIKQFVRHSGIKTMTSIIGALVEIRMICASLEGCGGRECVRH